jgi:hypothetical protein
LSRVLSAEGAFTTMTIVTGHTVTRAARLVRDGDFPRDMIIGRWWRELMFWSRSGAAEQGFPARVVSAADVIT